MRFQPDTMTESKWVMVLDAMYEKLLTLNSTTSGDIGPDGIAIDPDDTDFQYLKQETEIEVEELEQILAKLEEIGLIASFSAIDDEGLVSTYGLTEEGFRVTEERHNRKQERKVTNRTGTYTLILVFAIIIQTIPSLAELDGWTAIIYGIIILAMVLFIAIEIYDKFD